MIAPGGADSSAKGKSLHLLTRGQPWDFSRNVPRDEEDRSNERRNGPDDLPCHAVERLIQVCFRRKALCLAFQEGESIFVVHLNVRPALSFDSLRVNHPTGAPPDTSQKTDFKESA